MMRYFLFLLVAWLGMLPLVVAQTDSTQAALDKERFRPLGDTNRVVFYFRHDPDALYSIDTTLRDMEMVNPAWEDRWWGKHDLGNLGYPVLPMVFQVQPRGGFWIGLEQLAPYRLRREQVRFYQISNNIPYTDIYYSQLNQKNSLVRVSFAHKLAPQFYYTLNYNIINYFGYFDHQQARNQNIAFLGAYRSKFGKYRFNLDVLHNAAKLEENGGLVEDSSTVGVPSLFLASLATNSLSGKTEYKHTDLSLEQFWYNQRGDSATWTSPASMEFGHRIAFQFNKYKYFDKTPNGNYYGDYLVNIRGIRYLIAHQYLDNEISYRQALGGSLQQAPLWFRVSVLHRWNWGRQELQPFQRHQLGATFTLRSHPRFALHYTANAQLLWMQGRGIDFWAQGQLGYNFKRFGNLQAYALFQRHSPSHTAEHWLLSGETIWDRNFLQVQTLSIRGKYEWNSLRWLDLSAEFNNHTLTNWVYYDSLGISQQAPSSINLLQVIARLRLSVWQFGIEAEGAWQQVLVGSEYLRLPQFYATGKLYWEGKLFKSLRLRIGANVRWWSDYQGYGFLPFNGQFYLQQERPLTFYPIADAYVAFKVWRFRFFVNAENITQAINRQTYFNALHYSNPGFFVRLGVSWRIFD